MEQPGAWSIFRGGCGADCGNQRGKRAKGRRLGAKIEVKTCFVRLVTRRSNGLTAFVCNKSDLPGVGGEDGYRSGGPDTGVNARPTEYILRLIRCVFSFSQTQRPVALC